MGRRRKKRRRKKKTRKKRKKRKRKRSSSSRLRIVGGTQLLPPAGSVPRSPSVVATPRQSGEARARLRRRACDVLSLTCSWNFLATAFSSQCSPPQPQPPAWLRVGACRSLCHPPYPWSSLLLCGGPGTLASRAIPCLSVGTVKETRREPRQPWHDYGWCHYRWWHWCWWKWCLVVGRYAYSWCGERREKRCGGCGHACFGRWCGRCGRHAGGERCGWCCEWCGKRQGCGQCCEDEGVVCSQRR